MKRFALPAGLLVLVIGGVAWWRLSALAPPGEPPRPAADVALDPLVAAAVATAIDRVHSDPRSSAARAELAMVYHANGLPDLAERAYLQALEIDPDPALWWYHLGRVRGAMGRHDSALTAFGAAADRDPACVAVHWERGFLLLEMGRLDDADVAFERAAALRPGEPAAQVGRARVCLQRGEPAQAASLLQPLVAQFPGAGYLHQLLGNALQQMGRFPESAGHMARADGRVPRWYDPWTNAMEERRTGVGPIMERATQRAVDGDDEGALRLLEPLLASHPDDPMVLAKLGEIHLKKGDVERAKAIFDAVLLRDERNVFGHLYLARIHRLKNRPTDAARHAERAVFINPEWAPAWIEAGSAAADQARWGDAESALRRAVELGGPDDRVLLLLAASLHEQSRNTEAAAIVEPLLVRIPEHLNALVLMVRIDTSLGRFDQARTRLERAARLAPDDQTVRDAAAFLARVNSRP